MNALRQSSRRLLVPSSYMCCLLSEKIDTTVAESRVRDFVRTGTPFAQHGLIHHSYLFQSERTVVRSEPQSTGEDKF